jgi:hypothetical protein
VEEVRQHLDDILAAQSGQSETFGLTDADYFLIVALYLTPTDLESIRPALRDDPDRPVLGVGPRYRGYPVYPVDDHLANGSGCAEYRGVWFTYVPMAIVE